MEKDRNIRMILTSHERMDGTDFCSTILPFTSPVVQDGKWVTGQNPLSVVPAEKKIIDVLQDTNTQDVTI
jgi:putative intracellular protease/amidase